jgi:beta-phosphoglucomutase
MTIQPAERQMRLAVIFDVDGVLVDSYRAHLESWQALAREHGIALTEGQFAALFGQTSRDIICRIWGSGLSERQIAAIDQGKEAFYRDLPQLTCPAMGGAVELIDALIAAGFLLAVGSSGPPENVAMALERLGRAQCFGARVTGREVSRGKPDPQVFLMAAQRLGIAPRNCAVIEDAPAGIAAALAGGMTAVALTGTAPPSKLLQAHLMVHSLRELTAQRIADLIHTQPAAPSETVIER